MKYNVLILGGGGREHALVKAIKNSPLLETLYITKQDSALCLEAKGIDIDPMDNKAIIEFVKQENINLIIPGSEVYLENGIADAFVNSDVLVFGPKKQAAMIETSKSFAKDIMHRYGVPTATSRTFSDYELAKEYVLDKGAPIVIKYDGLAAGKGVVVAMKVQEAFDALKIMLKDKVYGSGKVVIEEYLVGEEFSYISLVNDELFVPLPVSKDYKRLSDGDQGPNTGGMGACTPVDFVDEKTVTDVHKKILKRILHAFKAEGIEYKGFLYAGLIKTEQGPKVIEFNARLGDPETEVILAKLESDLLESIIKILNNQETTLAFDNQYHLGVVMASKGYPGSYEKHHEIKGALIDESVLHMGVKMEDDRFFTDGGRVLFVKGKGNTLSEAKANAYALVDKIECDNLIYRKDIGKGNENG